MSDKSDLTPDDFVTEDELTEAIESAMSDVGTDADDLDLPDEVVTHDEAAQISERNAFDILEHIVSEDCDSEECSHLRDKMEERFSGASGQDESDGSDDDVSSEGTDDTGGDDDDTTEAEDTDEGDTDSDDGFHDPADDLPFEVEK